MKLIAFLTLITFAFACTPDEVEPSPESAGTMTCSLNGAGWSAGSFNNTLLLITDEEPQGKRFDLRGISGGIQIILTCAVTSSSTGNDIPVATYTTGSTTFEALVTIMEGWSILAMATGTESDPGTITITSINGTTKTCSGTFEFKARNLSTDEITHEAVSGVFTDLKYTVM